MEERFYLALVIKIVAYKKSSNRHTEFLVGPLDTLRPSVPFTENA